MEVSKRLDVSWKFVGSRNDFHDLDKTRFFQWNKVVAILRVLHLCICLPCRSFGQLIVRRSVCLYVRLSKLNYNWKCISLGLIKRWDILHFWRNDILVSICGYWVQREEAVSCCENPSGLDQGSPAPDYRVTYMKTKCNRKSQRKMQMISHSFLTSQLR